MTLRRRLVLLHSAFAAFAVFAALAIILGVQVYTEEAAQRLGELVSETRLVDELLIDVRVLDVHLHEVTSGRKAGDESFDEQRRAMLTRLGDVARFACHSNLGSEDVCRQLQDARAELAEDVEQVVHHVQDGDLEGAAAYLSERVEDRLQSVSDQLHRLRGILATQNTDDRTRLFTRHGQLLWLSLLVAASGVALVAAGAIVVRRRVVMPIDRLKAATEALGRGDLTHRVELTTGDELGQLAASFNTMAASLRASQLKFRSLFENQRDTVIVCDRTARVRECHAGDTPILPSAPAAIVGKRLGEVCPEANGSPSFWDDLIESVYARHETIRLNELSLGSGPAGRCVDVVAYPVDYAEEPYAALVLRDAEERRRLRQELRRGDQMAAAITVARGVAHDFKNLLHSAVNTLTTLEEQALPEAAGPRVHSALVACRQAVSLAKRLMRFATTDRGSPERVQLAEIIPLIVDSLDESFRDGLTLQVECASDVWVMIDRDHLTQIMLNLLMNAREAMPEGGRLELRAERWPAVKEAGRRSEGPWAVITVHDSGCGIIPQDRDRIFQPFFSSKPRTGHGPRGLGLAVVYALVTNAAGAVQVDSTPGEGSTFRVLLPLAEAP